MLTISKRLQEVRKPDGQLILPYEARCRSRLRTKLADGEDVAVFVERGQVLRGGQLMLADDGRVIEIRAAPEVVSTVRSPEALQLHRAAYHLGNRHVRLQIGVNWLRYLHDHVLDDMVRGLGLSVMVEEAPFEPEAGAYVAHEPHRAEALGEESHQHLP